MSLGNPFQNLLDDFIPSITDELLRNVIFSGDLSQIENFEEIFHPNILIYIPTQIKPIRKKEITTLIIVLIKTIKK